MKKTIFTLTLCLLLACSQAFAQYWQTFQTKSKFNNNAFEDSQGKIWFFSNYNFELGNLAMFDGSKAVSYSKFQNHKAKFVPMIAEAYGNFYMALQTGLLEYSNGQWNTYDKNSGLPSSLILNLYTDNSGTLWVCPAKFVTGEIGTWKNGKYNPINMQGHSGKAITSIIQDNDGNIWTGMHLGKVAKYDGEKWTNYDNQLSGRHIKSMAIDSKGDLWIAGIEGYFAKYENNHWKEFKHGSGYFNSVTAAPMFILGILPGVIMGYVAPDFTSWSEVVVDKEDNAWILVRKRGVVICDGNSYMTAEEKTAAPKTKKVTDLIVDTNGDIWLTDRKGNVMHYNHSKWKVYSKKDGIPKGLTGVFEDSKGKVWVTGKKAIAVLEK
jgi:ligand-binding sensor domain-containing protein